MTMLTKIWNTNKIRIRENDRYVCLSDLANASGKKLNDWLRLKSTKAYLEGFSGETGIPVSDLLEVQHGNETFAHPEIAIDFAKWCSVSLRIWVNRQINELLTTGQVSLKPEPKPQPLPQLNPVELVNAAKDIEEVNNASLQELLRNELIDYLFVKQGKRALPASRKEYTIVKVRAKELGYSTNEIGSGTGLGKFVAKNLKSAFSERIGKYEVKHYLVDDELDTTIHSYFGHVNALS